MMAAFLANYSATATSPAHAPPRNSFLPPGIKAPTIDFFDGKQQKSVRPWLQRTRSILKLMGLNLDSPNCVTFVSSFLTGPAQTWFSSEADRAAYGMADSAGFSTFDDFATALMRHLGDPNPEDKARKNLRSLKQTTSVKAYADEFQRIITYLPNRDADDLRFDFIYGLKPKIQELLVGKVDDSNMLWQDVRDLAYRFDDVVMSSRFNSTGPQPSRPFPSRDTRPHNGPAPMDIGATSTEYSRGRPSSPGPSSRGRSSTPHPRSSANSLPKLTDQERQKLIANNGCFRCRKFNAGHQARDCPGLSSVSVSTASASTSARQSPAASRSASPSSRSKN